MALFDLGQLLGSSVAIASQAISATTTNSSAVDTSGYQSVAFITVTGSETVNATNCFTASYLESDDNTVANATAIDSSRVLSTISAFDASSAVIHAIVPTKRYVFQRLTETGTASQTIASSAILGDARAIPVA